MRPFEPRSGVRTITSLQNERVKLIRSLEMRKARRETGLFVAEGPSVLVTARDAGWKPRMLVHLTGSADAGRNFLDCIKTRQQPIADVEQGHQVAVACHLANISLRTGRKLRWDAEKEEIIGDSEASKMLVRPYRKPWDDVLRGFKL